MKSTPLQNLIDWIVKFEEVNISSPSTDEIIAQAQMLLPEEKQNIVEAHNSGCETKTRDLKYNVLSNIVNGNPYNKI
jgi:hypothetical protein